MAKERCSQSFLKMPKALQAPVCAWAGGLHGMDGPRAKGPLLSCSGDVLQTGSAGRRDWALPSRALAAISSHLGGGKGEGGDSCSYIPSAVTQPETLTAALPSALGLQLCHELQGHSEPNASCIAAVCLHFSVSFSALFILLHLLFSRFLPPSPLPQAGFAQALAPIPGH